MTQLRWHIRHYGTGGDEWSVYENPGGGRIEPFPSILSWLTEPQAQAIADFLNDACGYNWQQRHPDWGPRTKGSQ